MKGILLALTLLLFTGCNVSPLSPDLDNKIDNQDGKIEEIKNNQNGIMLDLLKIRNEQNMHARDVDNQIQGWFNKSNSGIQILQGDGALILVFAVSTIAMLLIYHYRLKANKNQQSAEIMAQQIALYDDINLDDQVFMSAMNTEVEEDVYHMMVKAQSYTGRKRI